MKDPAALLYIDTWLTSTSGMDADTRGWYLNLILHQYDKKDLPNDVEELAVLAGVKFSEYKRFEQVFEQVFKQKFEQNENGRLENPLASEIIRKRESFKDKRSNSGKLSYFIRYITNKFKPKKDLLNFIKDSVDLTEVDLKNEQVLKHLFEHLSELYINGDGDNKEEVIIFSSVFTSSEFSKVWNELLLMPKWKKKPPSAIQKSLTQLERFEEKFAIELIEKTIAGNYQGVVFSNTDSEYLKWKNQSNGQTFKTTTGSSKTNTAGLTQNAAQRAGLLP